MDAPPPYPGGGGFIAPPAYSETDPSLAQASAPAFGMGGGEMMVVTGGWDGDRALETVEMLDPRTGQWSYLPNMMGECPGAPGLIR